jgi:hypothetical protein
MNVLFVLPTLLLAVFQGLPPLVPPLIPDSTAVVTGIVRRADTSRPVPDAQVTLMKGGESVTQAITHATVTDVNGRFTIKNVAGGDYRIIARAEGYFKPADDEANDTVIGTDIFVPEGQQVSGLIFELIPGATISGRVESHDGERVALASIEALQARYVSGRLTLQQVKVTSTDDLGEYRLFWLPPGDYYVRARYRTTSADRPERYAPVFFPGIADEAAAPLVTITAASEASAIDMRLSLTPLAGVTIAGQVTDPELAEREVTTVYVVPRDRTVTLGTDTADAFKNEASDREDGRFVLHGVPPGEYNLFPVVKDEDGHLRTVRIPVNVEDKAIEGLSAALSPTVAVRGRVTLDGKPWSSNVVLTSLDGLPGPLLGASTPAGTRTEARAMAKADAATGEFFFEAVNPGRYSVRLAAPIGDPPDAYVADVRQQDKSVFDSGILIGENVPDPLEVMLRTQGGLVTGTVFDSTFIRPVTRATLVLVPDDPRRRNLALYRTAVSLPDGSFNLAGVAPGAYKLFAWQKVTAGAWENAAFLRRYEDRSVPVVVDQNATKTVRIQAISQ